MKKDNAGFSLVELIVVVLIIAIVTGGGVLAFTTVHQADAGRAASKVEAMFKLARQKALSATEIDDSTCVYVCIYNDGGTNKVGIYKHEAAGGAAISSVSELDPTTDKVLEAPIAIENYKLSVYTNTMSEGWNTNHLLNSGDKLFFTFRRGTGGLNKSLSSTIGSSEIVNITLQGGETKKLILVKETGRMYEFK